MGSSKVVPVSNVEEAACVIPSSKRESFTVWMKSLVMQGNGCTVYDEKGELVYRIDNYDHKGSNEVYLMDLRGKVLFTILRRVKFFGRWRGYEGDNNNNNNKGVVPNLKNKPASFQVTKKGDVTLFLYNNKDSEEGSCCCCKIESFSPGKSSSAAAFKIIDCRNGVVLAEAQRKLSASGVLLGDDVLALTVEPQVDHNLVMALVTVYGLMHRIL